VPLQLDTFYHLKNIKEMGSIKTYRDLMVWQKSMTLVTTIYQTTNSFPSSEQFGLISQIRRAAVSLPSNIAEGYGRNSLGDYTRFLQIAISSLYEIQTQLEISYNLNYLPLSKFDTAFEQTREIERMLSGLIQKLKNNK
jgi:four helix bundle protein